MHKIYPYPKRFFNLDLLIVLHISLLLLLCWFPLGMSFLYYGIISPPVLRAIMYLHLTSVLAFIFLLKLKNDIRKTKIVVDEDRISKKSVYSVQIAHFNEISSIRIKRFLGLVTSVVLSYPNGSLRIPLFISGIDALLHDIHLGVSKHGKSEIIGEKKCARLSEKARVHETIKKMSMPFFGPLSGSIIVLMSGSVFVAHVYWNVSFLFVLIWGIIGFMTPLIAHGVVQLRLLHSKTFAITKNTDNGSSFIRSEYLTIGFIALLFYMVLGIFYRSFIAW